jgi:hypothetical protein
MKLKRMVIADPKQSTAQDVAEQCERLAQQRAIATTVAEMMQLIAELRPEVAVVSLELPGPPAKQWVPQLLKSQSGIFLISTYRELSVPEMERLGGLGVEEFIPHPIDILQVFRVTSRRFNVPFRRHDRYNLALDVFRMDGVMIGKTYDISEGGMCMEAIHPIGADESILVDLAIEDGGEPLRIRCHVLSVEGQAPAPVRARIQFVTLWGPDQKRLIRFLRQQSTELISTAD